jgi:hypothetical protein
MKTALHIVLTVATVFLPGSRPALAAQGDGGSDAGISCATDADCASAQGTPFCASTGMCVSCVDYTGSPCVPVACDGALCDTTNGSGCATATTRSNATWPVFSVLAALALAVARRRGRQSPREPR